MQDVVIYWNSLRTSIRRKEEKKDKPDKPEYMEEELREAGKPYFVVR